MTDDKDKECVEIKVEITPERHWWSVDDTDKRWLKILLTILALPFLILAILIIIGL